MYHILLCLKRSVITALLLLSILLLQYTGLAQGDKISGTDSLYKKYVQSAGFYPGNATPYYISLWKGSVPSTLKIIRKLNEYTAISELDPLVTLKDVSALVSSTIAKNEWKLS